MNINDQLRNSPYYEDFDPSKNYVSLLALPGRVEQSREFNEAQAVMRHHIKQIGDVTLKDGSIIEGCDINIKDKEVKITSGKLYLQGLVRTVSETQLDILGEGIEIVGAKLESKIITEIEDPALCDPASGYDNYGQPGAHRLQQSVKIVLNDPEAATLYRLEHGEVINLTIKPEINGIIDILSRRTYDESGNYKVEGLSMIDKKEYTNEVIKLSVEPGRAYIKGYEVNKPTPYTVNIRKALTTRKVLVEPKIYHAGEVKYELNNSPVKDILQIKAIVQVTSDKTRGNIPGGLDVLGLTPVVDIVEVKQNEVIFEKGKDYKLTGDSVDWSLGGKQPDIGSTYKVTWKYNKILVKNTDYKLTSNEDKTKWYVDFTGLNGDKPVDQTSFDTSYEYYLSRKDLVSIDKDGNIVVTEGQPDIAQNVSAPIVNNDNMLKLGTVFIPANDVKIGIINMAITRMSMEKLHFLLTRIEELEYNQAVDDLDKEASIGEPATQLKGILTDGFIGVSKCDFGHKDFDSAIDLFIGELTMPYGQTIKKLSVDKTDPLFKGKIFERNILSDGTEKVLITQTSATALCNVNPYMAYDKPSVLNLNPKTDNWIDEENITIENTNTSTQRIVAWMYRQGNLWAESERKKWESQGFDNGTFNKNNSSAVLEQNKITTSVIEKASMYIRPREVTITGENYPELTDNLSVTFDEIPVTCTPTSSEYAGSKAGTLKSDVNGVVKGKFTIPSNVRTGTRVVRLANEKTSATDNYIAEGIQRTVTKTVIHNKVVFSPYDPLAQSFSFEEDRIITGVGLYFGTKSDTEKVTIQIRNMETGTPGRIVYAEKVLDPKEVNVSSDATVETKVVFSNPVLCEPTEQYAIVIATDSDKYKVFISELGEKDVRTQKVVAKQAYTAGVFFTSSNALTWSAHQSKDLTFKMYGLEFPASGLITFDPLTDIRVNKFILAADLLTPGNSVSTWEYRINDYDAWLPCGVLQPIDLPEIATSIQFRMQCKNYSNVCPIVALDSLQFVGFLNKTSGVYITKNVSLPRGYTVIKQVVDIAKPDTTTVKVKFSTDEDGTTWTEPTVASSEAVDTEFTRYTFTQTLGESANNFRARIEMQTPNPTLVPRVKRLMNILK